jgi:hypothetical protein
LAAFPAKKRGKILKIGYKLFSVGEVQFMQRAQREMDVSHHLLFAAFACIPLRALREPVFTAA